MSWKHERPVARLSVSVVRSRKCGVGDQRCGIGVVARPKTVTVAVGVNNVLKGALSSRTLTCRAYHTRFRGGQHAPVSRQCPCNSDDST